MFLSSALIIVIRLAGFSFEESVVAAVFCLGLITLIVIGGYLLFEA